MFHLPEGCRVRRERTATSKVVRLPGEQVNSCAAACVEVCCEAFGIGVDGDEYTLIGAFPFKDGLLIREQDRAEIAVV